MTVVLNDPSFWPLISFVREMSYAEGVWRASAVGQSLTVKVASQLHRSLWCYMIVVRR
jgi:hypothetical protein